MTFEEAALAVAKAVAEAPVNMTVGAFHRRITSLVVMVNITDEASYRPMTVQEWRDSINSPKVVLTVAGGGSFGG